LKFFDPFLSDRVGDEDFFLFHRGGAAGRQLGR
jgi:hypothetical protein